MHPQFSRSDSGKIVYLLMSRLCPYIQRSMEACGVMVKVMGNGLVAPSSNPGCGNCISFNANSLGKGMNPTLPPAMGK